MDTKKDYLHPKWQKKRLEILERDNFTCIECGAVDKTLHVHHSHYVKDKKYWEYSNCSFKTLCSECHEKEHESIKSIDPYKVKRLSDLLSALHDRATERHATKLDYERYEYYADLFISYLSFGDSEHVFYEFDENETYGDDEINNFKILEGLMYYQINKRNVKTYIDGCIMLKGFIIKPSEIGKDLLMVSRDLKRSVF